MKESKQVINLFWWSPWRMPRLLKNELRNNLAGWAGLYRDSGRFMTNFGDELSPLVLEMATGREVRWAAPNKAELLAVGSILELAVRENTRECRVWGTGLRNEPSIGFCSELTLRNIEFIAVRGRLSRQHLKLPASTPIGDPGLLAPHLLKKKNSKTAATGVIPHFRTWTTASGRQTLRELEEAGHLIIPPTRHPIDVINQISSVDSLFSSSLHGVIVAHSLGIPAQLLEQPGSNAESESRFKFEDYYSSIEQPVSVTSVAELFQPNKWKPIIRIAESHAAQIELNSKILGEGLFTSLRNSDL